MSYGPPPPPPMGYGVPGYGGTPAVTNQKAIWSLVLGILQFFCCGIVMGIPAIVLGRQAEREIAMSGGQQGGAGLAKAGYILGIIGCVLFVLAVIGVLGAFVIGGGHSASTGTPTY